MTVALLVIGDGRDEYRERTLASVEEMLPTFDRVVEIDDREHRLGFAGAIQEGWRRVLDTGADWLVHLEADFTFNAPVDVERIIALLQRRRDLAQVVLKRQAWNHEERAAGGIVELHPDDFTEESDGDVFTTHRRFFSTNPSVYSADLCWLGWPQVAQSEGIFTHRLLRAPSLRFAFWGGKFDPPLVHHIGEERAGCGY